ncbi:MAG: cystathionine gamma-synthase [Burkholderiales bacterium RIFCSPLOWO2_12_FULL_64_99]|nr:MAG: cystathionine gamma-synthase [Burkholderiales bacterium RIFCSPHIGHO2_12_FULL_63_20]OGB61635.1 MAG: cystathionine gamma-synthase [Burkholderiales bacterium RIFCSPLOWO2_12_FULL_64_99]
MTSRLLPWVLLAAAGGLHAQPVAPANKPSAPTTFRIGPAEAYDVSRLPDDAYGQAVRYGKELTDRTFAYIGPEVKNPKMRYAGNNLACASCHEASGTKKFAIPWVGAHATFPQYRGREDGISTLEERVNGCMERSMSGKALPFDSKEMKAFVTYMHFLSKDVPVGAKVEGQGLPPFKAPNRRADTVAGGQTYQAKCSACHGVNGAGIRAGAPGSATGYTFPPLWGKDTFNHGAGMNRLLTASAFIKANMPLGTTHDQPQLSDDEAYDVAAFVLSHARPLKAHTERDFPARWNKPVDAAFPPYVDGASADQHRYGPYPPLQEKMKQLKDSLMKTSAK